MTSQTARLRLVRCALMGLHKTQKHRLYTRAKVQTWLDGHAWWIESTEKMGH